MNEYGLNMDYIILYQRMMPMPCKSHPITNDLETDTFKFCRATKVKGHLRQGEHVNSTGEPGRFYRFFAGSQTLVILA